VGGLDLCGSPELLIAAIKTRGNKELTILLITLVWANCWQAIR
jgi:acyl CoA:acetate/3-ketoacid CoA transferase alpha subunit